MTLKKLILFLIATIISAYIYGQGDSSKLKIFWEKNYQFTDSIIKIHPVGDSFLLVLSKYSNGSVHLRKYLSKDGNLLWETTFPELENKSIRSSSNILEDKFGDFLLMINTKNNNPTFIKINNKGRVMVIADLILKSVANDTKLTVLSAFLDDSVINIFCKRSDFFVYLKTDKSGKLFSENFFYIQSEHIITDVFINNKKEPVIVTKTGFFDKYGGGESKLNIFIADTITKTCKISYSTNGKNGKICQLKNLNYYFVFDGSSQFPTQKIDFEILSQDFKLILHKNLFENLAGASYTHINKISLDKIGVYAIKKLQLVFFIFDSTGNEQNVFFSDLNKVITIDEIFYQNQKIGVLQKIINQLGKTDFASMLKTKLILYYFY